MPKKQTTKKEKKPEVPKLEDVEALTIEELVQETFRPVSSMLTLKANNGSPLYKKVVFRLLDVTELSQFDDIKESAEDTRQYYRSLLSTVSISPKFKDDTEESFKGVSQRFMLEYGRVINEELRKNNFL